MGKYSIIEIVRVLKNRISCHYQATITDLITAIKFLNENAEAVKSETDMNRLPEYDLNPIESESILFEIKRYFLLFFIFSHKFRKYLLLFKQVRKKLRKAIDAQVVSLRVASSEHRKQK